MRFVLIVIGLVIAGLIGLYIYGGMIEPETRLIEQDVTEGANAQPDD